LLIDIQKELSKVSDIDAIVARMQLDRYSVADLLKLKQSLEALGLCKKMILEHGNKKLIKLLNIE
jgi:DNA mismatch repair ATPase MutS